MKANIKWHLPSKYLIRRHKTFLSSSDWQTSNISRNLRTECQKISKLIEFLEDENFDKYFLELFCHPRHRLSLSPQSRFTVDWRLDLLIGNICERRKYLRRNYLSENMRLTRSWLTMNIETHWVMLIKKVTCLYII